MADVPKRQQTLKEGVGPVFHRTYQIALGANYECGRQTMAHLQRDPNAFSPQWLAKFEKARGDDAGLDVGDCFQISLSGPWDAPVRVASVSDTHFSLVTLEGHLEVGEIHFRLEAKGDQTYFVIESLARSRDQLVDLLYDKIPVARMAQTGMWKCVCRSFAEECRRLDTGAQATIEDDEVEVDTEKMDQETGVWRSA